MSELKAEPFSAVLRVVSAQLTCSVCRCRNQPPLWRCDCEAVTCGQCVFERRAAGKAHCSRCKSSWSMDNGWLNRLHATGLGQVYVCFCKDVVLLGADAIAHAQRHVHEARTVQVELEDALITCFVHHTPQSTVMVDILNAVPLRGRFLTLVVAGGHTAEEAPELYPVGPVLGSWKTAVTQISPKHAGNLVLSVRAEPAKDGRTLPTAEPSMDRAAAKLANALACDTCGSEQLATEAFLCVYGHIKCDVCRARRLCCKTADRPMVLRRELALLLA